MNSLWIVILAFVILNFVMAVVTLIGLKRGWFAVHEDRDDDDKRPH